MPDAADPGVDIGLGLKGTPVNIERIYPPGLRRPPAYTPVVRVTGGTTVYLSGQVPTDAEGRFPRAR